MRIIVDTDPGMGTPGADPEDGMALLYALNSPEVSLDGITLVQGNVPLAHSMPNAHRLLDLAGRNDVPVHAGAAASLHPDRRTRQSRFLTFRAVPETGDVPEGGAAAFLADSILDAPGEVTVVAIGPLTNVARAFQSNPEVADKIKRLVIMGGTVATPGNVSPAAEFNIWMDPDAAAIVFCSGAPITMVGLDVCHQTHLDRNDVDRIRERSGSLALHVAKAATSWIEVRENVLHAEGDLHLYDTLAVACAIEPALISTMPALVEVETSNGPAQGMTVTHTNEVLKAMHSDRPPNADVAVGVDVEAFESRWRERVVDALGD